MSAAFRCAAASLARSEPLLGTASAVRAYVLVEHPGAWGRTALRDARLPEPVRHQLLAVSRLGAKTLLIRRHGRSRETNSRRIFVAWSGPATPWLETALLADLEDLRDVDLTMVAQGQRPGLETHTEPLVCVCTHGRHDTCCAEWGRPLANALHRSHPGPVWEVSHIGGDRFAGNVVVLPEGLYYGRVTPGAAPALVDEHLAGRIDLDHLRGRSSLAPAVQAAEVFVRRRLGEVRLEVLRLATVERSPEQWTVSFDIDGQVWRCKVRVGKAETSQLTCAAMRLSPAPVFTEIEVWQGK